jgi:hypothetical protein
LPLMVVSSSGIPREGEAIRWKCRRFNESGRLCLGWAYFLTMLNPLRSNG